MDPTDLPAGPFDGRDAFRRALVIGLAQARRRMLWLDRDLSDWPIEQPAVARIVERFCTASPQATLRVLVHDARWLERRAPRLAQLRRRAPHAIECRRLPASLAHVTDGMLVVDQRHVVRRTHVDRWRGRLLLDAPAEAEPLAARHEALWHAAEPCLPATPLGL